MAHVVQCPTCGADVEWSEAFPVRPFCSERCRLIDLGAWAAEPHVISGSTLDDEEEPGSPQQNS